MFFILLLSVPRAGTAQELSDATLSELKKLSLEELMSIEVTTVSMRPEKISEVASAVQVITSSDIKRSAFTRLPEALRLAPNLQVGQANSHDWAITSRGFNGLPSAGGILANKLLVMIDGRTIYNPLFGGVFWDAQNIMLKDVDRIEVVSGPGGTIWGANAVNGVINVIQKNAQETQGTYLSAITGTFLRDQYEARYGFKAGKKLFGRVYGQRFDQKATMLVSGAGAKDAWNFTQGGFRLDYLPSEVNSLSIHGDLYMGQENDSIRKADLTGQNLMAVYSHKFSGSSNFKLQFYYDRILRKSPLAKPPSFYELNTYDIEAQNSFAVGSRHKILVGLGYRFQKDRLPRGLTPLSREMPLYCGFVQDEISLVHNALKLTIGSKFSHNVFTGMEYQPGTRIAWIVNPNHTVWSGVSRSVRTPSRFDADITINPQKFISEKVYAYEIGYRVLLARRAFLSFASFYNQYDDLRSLDSSGLTSPAIIIANSQQASSWGLEVSGNFQANNWWRLRGGYTFFDKRITTTNPKTLPFSREFESVDAKSQVVLQSIMDLPKNIELDITGRYIDQLPEVKNYLSFVPAYFTFDVRVAWRVKFAEFSVAGQNLMRNRHTETGASMIPKTFYGRVVCQF